MESIGDDPTVDRLACALGSGQDKFLIIPLLCPMDRCFQCLFIVPAIEKRFIVRNTTFEVKLWTKIELLLRP